MPQKKNRILKVCPKCKQEHEAKGTYCSRKCANSRTFTEESRAKTSSSMKKYLSSLTEEEKQTKLLLLEQMSEKAQEKRLIDIMTQPWDTLGQGTKRTKVILEQDNRCNRCGISEWLGEPITLELEHKDGDHNNNSRENLEGLCPNCHSLTSTWRGRKNSRSNSINVLQNHSARLKNLCQS